MKTFTKQFMEANRGCYTIPQLYACSFMQKETIELKAIIQTNEILVPHKYWFVCHIGLLSFTDRKELVRLCNEAQHERQFANCSYFKIFTHFLMIKLNQLCTQ